MIVANIIKLRAEPELDLDYAMTVAYLHDTIEDTKTTYEDIKNIFGKDVADGVLALTKDKSLSHEEKLDDSLSRIKKLGRREVAAVKIADRICNLFEIPVHWSKQKAQNYIEESIKIEKTLGYASPRLHKILLGAIENYKTKIQ